MVNDRPILLQATSLTRHISANARVADVSLSLREGDVLGLLGLNGAGKSTTLKMLAGILVPDSGEIKIAGYSLADDPLKARAQLGYLPDNPPLYPDMRVSSYLTLAARLRKVPKREVKSAVSQVIERCDLTQVAQQRIASLSKGFRQRVGLAQAIVHSPSLILLDEPSNGLDPHQMQSMRELIQNLGQSAAVIFSTHLLPEAVAVCNHIAVMHNGTIVASELGHPDTQSLQRDDLDTLFANLVQFGTPKAPVPTLKNPASSGVKKGVIDA